MDASFAFLGKVHLAAYHTTGVLAGSAAAAAAVVVASAAVAVAGSVVAAAALADGYGQKMAVCAVVHCACITVCSICLRVVLIFSVSVNCKLRLQLPRHF